MASSDEFPALQAHGLKATAIRGDGNCLFNAFSDQIYGDESHHKEIRARVVKEMRDHPEQYINFVPVNDGGGYRRNPKRKNVAPAPVSAMPSTAQINANFEAHLDRMQKNGTYGDNCEVIGFARAYNTDVVIYSHAASNYMIKASHDDVERPRAYIALHNYEHYSSVRKINGPFTGLPQIPNFVFGEGDPTPATRNTVIHDWMIKNVMAAMPDLANEEVIKTALIENHGNVNNAVSYLMEFQYSSNPSTPGSLSPSNSDGSVSIQRESDGESDESDGPNKRQNRRKDRTMKALPKRRNQPEETKPELDVIPTIELTQPDAEKANYVSTQIHQPTPLKAVHDLTKDNDSVVASDGDDEFKPEDSASEVSSRSPSVNPANPRPRAKIILNNNRKKTGGRVTKYASHTYQTPQSSSQSSQDASYTKNPPGSNQKSRVTARQRKDDKKLAQKQAAKERKRSKSEGLQPEPSTSNTKHVSPPMEKVLCVGNMIVA
ncbi:OTU domain-containing protein 3 [Lachnellula cervina]|uniref:OTU domain-containing protein 3 n=1 Tax=Lachnellula cervina TaxID=1316786 RepID=A0A7D8USU4_9HELO|nr:OTU domain-containing protein 3 [Lachnellula cervina]